MGEMTDAILEGELCEGCFMPFRAGTAEGFPRTCNGCKESAVYSEMMDAGASDNAIDIRLRDMEDTFADEDWLDEDDGDLEDDDV